MQKWIIENNFLISSKLENIDGVKAFVVLNRDLNIKEFKRSYYEVKSIPLENYESVRSLIIYTDFLRRVGFAFALISTQESELFNSSARILIHRGYSFESAIELLKTKTGYSPTSRDIGKLKDFEKYVELFDLSGELKKIYDISELVRLLRNECPWDREQTHKSLVPELIEESLELSEEIVRQNEKGIEEELGDTLLQILFHCVLGEEEGFFDISSVSDVLFEKLYQRHPHVFKDSRVSKSREVLDQWENIKKSKRSEKGMNISKILASFITTVNLQEFARKEGFDFSNVAQIETKISEELSELNRAMADKTNVREEIGDLLFSVINLARFLNIDPSHALFLSMSKFERRFTEIKNRVPDIKALNEAELDKIWEEIKKDEQSR